MGRRKGEKIMKIPAEFEDILRGVELTEREKRFLRWITSWDDHTMQNMRTVVEKVRSTLSTLQAENKELRAELERVKEDWSTAVNGLVLMQKKLDKVYRMIYDPLIIVDGGHLRPVKNTSRQQVYKKLIDLQVEMGINRGFPWGEMRMEKKDG